jgi:hypothetical protein
MSLDSYLVVGLIIFYESRGQTISWFISLLYSFWLPQIIHSIHAHTMVPLRA